MAAWTATENFDSYSTGAIAGNNGGSGWSGAWASDTVGILVSTLQFQTTPNSILGPLGAVGWDSKRSLTTGVTSGIFQFYWWADATPSGTTGASFILRDGTTTKFAIGWADGNLSGNNIGFTGSTTITAASSPTTGVWHQIQVEFDQANNRARISVDGGAWSSYVTSAGGTYTSISSIRITKADGGGVNMYWDSFGVGSGPVVGPANLKTWNTIPTANIKTLDTIAIANLKSIDTIT